MAKRLKSRARSRRTTRGRTARPCLCSLTPRGCRGRKNPRGEGSKTKTPYLTLDVSGEGVRPRLDFDAREVTLAPTPPGVPTTRRFHLVNRGYANERVSHRLPSDTNKIDLRVSYPEGTQIGVARPSLPVDVTFVSPVPVSFTAAIDFLDEEGNRFCVPCSGVADNSALTLENFVDVNNTRGEVDDRLVVQLAAAAAPVGASSALASARRKFARKKKREKKKRSRRTSRPSCCATRLRSRRPRFRRRSAPARTARRWRCGWRRRQIAGPSRARTCPPRCARAGGASSWTSSSFGAGARSWARP